MDMSNKTPEGKDASQLSRVVGCLKNTIYAFKVKDYTTILIGRYDKKTDSFYVERGDGTKYPYSSYRVEWSELLF